MSVATINAPKQPEEKLLTIEEFLEQYGDRPADLVRGRVVEQAMPGFQHGKICRKAAKLIGDFVDDRDLGSVVTNDTHVRIERDPDSARGMDVAFISYQRLPKGTEPVGTLEIAPELVVEVRSPTDRWVLILTKVLEYLDIGVSVVIVFDPETTSAIIYRPDDRQQTFNAEDMLILPDVLPGFSMPVAKFFE